LPPPGTKLTTLGKMVKDQNAESQFCCKLGEEREFGKWISLDVREWEVKMFAANGR
jgi:hypothetical protein